MGRAKAEQMEHEGNVQVALSHCIEVGAISECEIHNEYVDSGEFFEYEELTEQIIQTVDDALAGFKDKKHLQECVEEAMQMAGDECGYCAKNSDS